MAYGAIPIPPGLRQITDLVFDAVVALIENHGRLDDSLIAIARDHVPQGLPRDVFDTLVRIIHKHQPIAQAAAGLAEHYIGQYTQGLAPALEKGLAKLAPGVQSVLSKLPDPTKVYEHVAPITTAAHLPTPAIEAAVSAIHAAHTSKSAAATA
jgi:hypothetical protein